MEQYLAKQSIDLYYHAAGWQDAVVRAGELLFAGGKVTREYGQAMVKMVKEYGSYMVVAPGLAMPHARPQSGTLETGISVLRLVRPVEFPGNEDNPVIMLIALAATTNDRHLDLMKTISRIVADQAMLESLKSADEKGIIDLLLLSMPDID